jgi:hypothetical protein
MNGLLSSRRRRFAAASIVAVAVIAASGYAYAAITATNQTYTGCLQAGDITNVAIGSAPLKTCMKPATQISWSQTGPPGTNGTNGVSVTSANEPSGANCANGGSKFTAAGNNVTYACDGAPGGLRKIEDMQGASCGPAQIGGTVDVKTNLNDGSITLRCVTTITVTANDNVEMDIIGNESIAQFAICPFDASCQLVVPLGQPFRVIIATGNSGAAPAGTNPLRPFNYTCPGQAQQAAKLTTGPAGHPVYLGSCPDPDNFIHTTPAAGPRYDVVVTF